MSFLLNQSAQEMMNKILDGDIFFPCSDMSNEDIAFDLVLENCYSENSEGDATSYIFNQLENFTIEEKLNYCFSDLAEINVSPPNCEGCSVGEAQTVWADEIKSLNMLDCAIDKLREFDGAKPLDVKLALETHFGGTNSTLVATYIKNLFSYIRSYPYDRGYQAQNNGDRLCGTNTQAWTLPVVHAANIRLCRPNYWNESDKTERAATLIHEWMHLYYFAGDIAYDWDTPAYNNLSTLQQLFNADSFSELVKELCDE